MNKDNMFRLYALLSTIVKGNKKVNYCSLHFTNSNREECRYYISLIPMKDSYDSIEITSSLVDNNLYEVEYEYGKYRSLTFDDCVSFVKRMIEIKF
jgi:hypothetical protein